MATLKKAWQTVFGVRDQGCCGAGCWRIYSQM